MKDGKKPVWEGLNDTSLLLIGNSGATMMEDALKAASILLETDVERLDLHPDYMLVRTDNKTIGTETADQIVERSFTLPVSAHHIVIVIDGIEKMTPQAQNKLLKLLEESKIVIIIGVAYADTLLKTVKSRMRCVTYRPLDYQSYKEQLNDVTADPLIWYYATGGLAGAIPDTDVVEIFSHLKEAISAGNVNIILEILHMVKEKDEMAFFLKHREHTEALLSFMGALISEMYVSDTENGDLQHCVQLLAKHRRESKKPYYTKDSFFACMAELMDTMGKRG